MKLHVGNLPDSVSDEKLNELAREFGAVESAEVVKDRYNAQSRGYGFLVFTSDDEARAAIAGLNGKDVDGKALKVSEARSPKDRQVRA